MPPRARAEPIQSSDRTRLAHQYRKGTSAEGGLDDDTDIAQSFPVSTFALGSTRYERQALKFMSGFVSDADTAHSRVSFNFDRRWVYIYAIPLTHHVTPPALVSLEAEIPFEDIVPSGVRVTRSKPDSDGYTMVTLTITTHRPARFYAKIEGKNIMRRATERDFVFSLGPHKSTPERSFQDMKAKNYIIYEGHAGPLEAVPEDPMTVQVNAWLSWQFELRLDTAQRKLFSVKILDLGLAAYNEGLDLIAHLGEKKIRIVPPENMAFVDPRKALSNLEFHPRYLVEGLVSRGIFVQSEIPALTAALAQYCPKGDLKERVLTSLFSEGRVRDLDDIVSARAKQLRRRRLQNDPHLVWVYKCVVTPTRVCLFPPELEPSSDALRKHNTASDRFLLVQFADENDRIQINAGVLEADAECPASGTIARVRRALQSGLNIAGRHYVFLAYTLSSIRKHSCWFLAEDTDAGFTAASVRNALNFDAISTKIVAQHASHMGISFSPSRALNIKPNIRNTIPDVLLPKTKLNFTKGAGLCGYKIAREAAREFGITAGVDAYPSAIQICGGGAEGVLSVWPEQCGPTDVIFRKSQVKFKTSSESKQYGLSVVRISSFRHAFLNRQFILLLSHLGTKNELLEELFLDAINATRNLPYRFSRGKQTERDLRAAKGLCQLPIKELAEAGFNNNPMFVDVCRVLEAHILSDFKWKARLEIRQSVCLMGIADEAGVLKHGEVFCQYQNPADDRPPKIVRGLCVAMRAPALHPGDIRLVRATDHPALRHLKNVIVFSVRGPEPMPNMCSRGNLGGDDYSLIWDDRLIPNRRLEESAKYTIPKPEFVKHVTSQDVKDFFIDHLKKDILDRVSNAYLAHADHVGPQSQTCLDLAQQAKVAADFSKTGVPALLAPELLPKRWPTFLGKNFARGPKCSYVSRQILGRLFLFVQPDPGFVPSDIRDLWADDMVDPRLASYQVPQGVLDDAYRLKQDYDDTILGMMKRYRVTEAEVVAGIVLRNAQRRRGSDSDLKQSIIQNYRALATHVLELVDKFLAKRRYKTAITGRQVYALAAYQVTYIEDVRKATKERLQAKDLPSELGDAAVPKLACGSADSPGDATPEDAAFINGGYSSTAARAGSKPLISFPWVFWEELTSLPNVRPPQ